MSKAKPNDVGCAILKERHAMTMLQIIQIVFKFRKLEVGISYLLFVSNFFLHPVCMPQSFITVPAESAKQSRPEAGTEWRIG